MQITDSDFTRPKDEYSSYFGRLGRPDVCEYGSLATEKQSCRVAAVKLCHFLGPL